MENLGIYEPFEARPQNCHIKSAANSALKIQAPEFLTLSRLVDHF